MINRRYYALLAFVMLTTVSMVHGHVQQVTLRVDGLACPFCAFGLEKKIKKLPGYDSLHFLINEGKVIVGWRDDQPLDLKEIDKAVDKAGFTLRGVTGTFIGTISRGNKGELYLDLIEPVEQRLHLDMPKDKGRIKTKKTDQIQSTPQPLRERLEGLLTQGNLVEITGKVEGHSKNKVLLNLSINSLAIVSPPEEFGCKVISRVENLVCSRCVTRVVRTFMPLEDVLHIQADHLEDEIQIWTQSEKPNLMRLRDRIELLGFKVEQIRVQKEKEDQKK